MTENRNAAGQAITGLIACSAGDSLQFLTIAAQVLRDMHWVARRANEISATR